MEDEVQRLVERMWKDIASLPWTDPIWVKNKAAQETTRQHFVNATREDFLEVIKKGKSKDAEKK